MKQLQQEKRWCLWKLEPRKDKPEELTKVPKQVNGYNARSNDPRTWNYYNAVCDALTRNPGKFDGVGLFFSDGVCGVDVDGDHAQGGEHNTLEADVLARFSGTYAERSPSGSGVHIIFRADPYQIPTKIVKDKKGVEHLALDGYYQKNPKNKLEFYAGGLTYRFFTFTGNSISTDNLVTDQTDTLLAFMDKYMRLPEQKRKTAPSGQERPPQPATPGTIDISQRLQKARSAADGAGFQQLFDQGDTSGYDGDHSTADLALCAKLAFWLNADPVLMDEAFRSSALMRDKWDERRGAETYGEMTIRKAINTNTSVYQEPQRPTVAQDFGAPEPALKYRPAGRDLTDAGNAELFAKMNRDRLRWCAALGWLAWNGKQWEVDDQAAARAALDFSKAMLDEAMQFYMTAISGGNENPAAKEYFRHAMKLRSTAAQLNMLTLAKARMAIRARELDADPEILNTVAGIVNLRSGAIGPHDPERFCTKLAPAAPSNDGAEMWDNFLDLVTCGDGDLKSYLQRVAGMAVVGKVYEEGIQITVGGGRNGKSTFYGALSKVLGDYAGPIDPDVLMVKKNTSRFELSDLRGKRLALCSELEAGQRLSIKALKRISSREAINIERKYKDQEQVTPTHTIIMHTNVLPIVGDARDGATWRRLTVIPFNATMPAGNKDIKAYDDVLMKNAGGAILQWMIDGAKLYLEAGGNLGDLPAAVLDATKQYQAHEDWLQPFLDECCEFGGQYQTKAGELYAAYEAFSRRRGDRYTRKGREFYDPLNEALTSMGLRHKTQNKASVWCGVRVIQDYQYQGAAAEYARPLTGADDDFDPLS